MNLIFLNNYSYDYLNQGLHEKPSVCGKQFI